MFKNKNDLESTLSIKELFLMGAALFSMHFGSSSMTWPMNWGKESGNSVYIAFLGVFITALLMPMLGYVALVRGRGTYISLVKNILPKFGDIFTVITILMLGPLFVIPRMSASSWDGIVQITEINTISKLPIIIFSIIFYSITYWFLSGRSDTMDKIGKLLFPILVIIVICIIVKGLVDPVSQTSVSKSYEGSAFSYGFVGGYATGDILCALVFGIVILNNLKSKGVKDDNMNSSILKVGILGMGMLTLSHLGHMIVGSNTGGVLGPTGNLTYVKLYTKVAFILWGNLGGILYCIALFIASLTTAVGITAAVAELSEEISNKKISYKKATLAICISSTLIGAMGLDNILSYVGPLLNALSPSLVILILFYVFVPDIKDCKFIFSVRCTMYTSLVYGFLDALYSYNILCDWNLNNFEYLYLKMPLASMNLSWIIGCSVVAILSYILSAIINKCN